MSHMPDAAPLLLIVKHLLEKTLFESFTLQSHPQLILLHLTHKKVFEDSVYDQWFIHSLINKSCYKECAVLSVFAAFYSAPGSIFWSLEKQETWDHDTAWLHPCCYFNKLMMSSCKRVLMRPEGPKISLLVKGSTTLWKQLADNVRAPEGLSKVSTVEL